MLDWFPLIRDAHPDEPAATILQRVKRVTELSAKPEETLTDAECTELSHYIDVRIRWGAACTCAAGWGPHRNGCPALGGAKAISSHSYYMALR
jgi:hypothetical protein